MRAAEVGRTRTLRRDKDNFGTLHDRSKKIVTQGPYKVRPPPKISTKTIDTDTIGRVNKGTQISDPKKTHIPAFNRMLTLFSLLYALLINAANQKMSQFLYNLANEPSVGLFHVNEHIRRTVPRLVEARKQMDFQSVELDKSSCDVDDILPIVRTIGSLTAFKSMQSILLKSLQLTAPRPAAPSASSSSRSLGPTTPVRSPATVSPGGSQRNIAPPSPSQPEPLTALTSPQLIEPALVEEPVPIKVSEPQQVESMEHEVAINPETENVADESVISEKQVAEEEGSTNTSAHKEVEHASQIESSAPPSAAEIGASIAATAISLQDAIPPPSEESKEPILPEQPAEEEPQEATEFESSTVQASIVGEEAKSEVEVLKEEEDNVAQEEAPAREVSEAREEAPAASEENVTASAVLEAAPKSQSKKKKRGGGKQGGGAELAPKAF